MLLEPFVFKLNQGSGEFFRDVFQFRETPLPIGGNVGTEQFTLPIQQQVRMGGGEQVRGEAVEVPPPP